MTLRHLVPALLLPLSLASGAAFADTGDTGGDPEGPYSETTELQTWNAEEAGCSVTGAPAFAVGIFVAGLALVGRRRD